MSPLRAVRRKTPVSNSAPAASSRLRGTACRRQDRRRRTVKVAFPADYGAEHLAGKDAVFDVKVKEVKAPAEVTIDDELAKRFGFDELAKLRDALADQIRNDYTRMSRMHLKRAMLDKLDELHDFELPPSMVEQEFEQIWKQFEHELSHQNKTAADLDEPEEEVKAEYRKIAERRVRLGLLLAEVGEKNNISVTEQELNQALAERAASSPARSASFISSTSRTRKPCRNCAPRSSRTRSSTSSPNWPM